MYGWRGENMPDFGTFTSFHFYSIPLPMVCVYIMYVWVWHHSLLQLHSSALALFYLLHLFYFFFFISIVCRIHKRKVHFAPKYSGSRTLLINHLLYCNIWYFLPDWGSNWDFEDVIACFQCNYMLYVVDSLLATLLKHCTTTTIKSIRCSMSMRRGK